MCTALEIIPFKRQIFFLLLIHVDSFSVSVLSASSSLMLFSMIDLLFCSDVRKMEVIGSYEESLSLSDDKVSHARRKCSSALSLLDIHRGPALA
jgi:hypothetical protein